MTRVAVERPKPTWGGMHVVGSTRGVVLTPCRLRLLCKNRVIYMVWTAEAVTSLNKAWIKSSDLSAVWSVIKAVISSSGSPIFSMIMADGIFKNHLHNLLLKCWFYFWGTHGLLREEGWSEYWCWTTLMERQAFILWEVVADDCHHIS